MAVRSGSGGSSPPRARSAPPLTTARARHRAHQRPLTSCGSRGPEGAVADSLSTAALHFSCAGLVVASGRSREPAASLGSAGRCCSAATRVLHRRWCRSDCRRLGRTRRTGEIAAASVHRLAVAEKCRGGACAIWLVGASAVLRPLEAPTGKFFDLPRRDITLRSSVVGGAGPAANHLGRSAKY